MTPDERKRRDARRHPEPEPPPPPPAAEQGSAPGDPDDPGLLAGFCGAPDAVETPAPPPPPPVVDAGDLDWERVLGAATAAAAIRARAPDTVRRIEALLDEGDGATRLLFGADRSGPDDRAILVRELDPETPLWFVGDLHGDLLGLEAALAHARAASGDGRAPRIVFLGDLFDDGGFGLEVLLRFYELVLEAPDSVCILAGNHDESLGWDGQRFTATVSPSDFIEELNAHLDTDEWAVRAGRAAVRLFAAAPRALFLPDGLLVAHGGFPHTDLHGELAERGDFNDPRCLQDFVWLRAHPRARKKIPNRTTRGGEFGREDFAAFCAVATELGRPVARMVRGHDHVEQRFLLYPAYEPHPLVTVNTMSRRLPREMFGPYERVPCIARWVPGHPPQVHRLLVPPEMVRAVYPPPPAPAAAAAPAAAPEAMATETATSAATTESAVTAEAPADGPPPPPPLPDEAATPAGAAVPDEAAPAAPPDDAGPRGGS